MKENLKFIKQNVKIVINFILDKLAYIIYIYIYIYIIHTKLGLFTLFDLYIKLVINSIKLWLNKRKIGVKIRGVLI